MADVNDVFAKLDEIENLKASVESTKAELSGLLEEVKKEVGSAFTDDQGRNWQIRFRQGRNYICQMTKKPGRKKAEEVVVEDDADQADAAE